MTWKIIYDPVPLYEISFNKTYLLRIMLFLRTYKQTIKQSDVYFTQPILYDTIEKEIIFLTTTDNRKEKQYLYEWTKLQDKHNHPISDNMLNHIERLQLLYNALRNNHTDAIYRMNTQLINKPIRKYIFESYSITPYYILYIVLLFLLVIKYYTYPRTLYIVLILFFTILYIFILRL